MSTKGFTLIETLVAIAILTLSVAGPLLVASRALVSAQIAQEQLTASYLAQEGIEYVRMMRDDEYLAAYQDGGSTVSSTAWSNFVSGTGSASIAQCVSVACTLDPINSALQPCGGMGMSACSSLPLYVESNGLYTQVATGNTKTPYVRTIQATPLSATEEKIVSTVLWVSHGQTYSVSVDDHLTAWQ